MISPLDIRRLAVRIETLGRHSIHDYWNPGDELEFKRYLRKLPTPEVLREMADTPLSGDVTRTLNQKWQTWITWTLRAEGLVRDNDPRNPKRMMRDMMRGKYPFMR